MHRQLTAIISQVGAVLSDVDEAPILEAAHVILQLGMGVAASHDEVNSQRVQARQDAREAFSVESFGVGEESAVHIDGDN